MPLAALVLAILMPVQGEARRVFLDCQSGGCDTDYLRTEITFVNYVRDRADADIHILVTTQGAGGGTAYTLTFIGLGALAGRSDTLHYTSSQTDTPDERRRGLARVIRLGLVRYVLDTPVAGQLEVRYQAPARGAGARQGPDPWNYWVFRASTNVRTNGEESTEERQFSGDLSARRTTEEWKVRLGLDAEHERTRYQLDDTTSFISRRTDWSFDVLAVKSLGEHWSLGLMGEVEHSTFRNADLKATAAPAIEFNVFPYSESTRRILTIQYAAGIQRTTYLDSTIFGLLRETRPLHRLQGSLEVRQPWGNSFLSFEFNQYLHDARKLSIGLNGSANVRLIRGLGINFFGGYSVIRDQIYLPASGATPEEIIARQRALATNYSYYSGFGLSYTFGSIYNNVVNPRF